MTCLKVFLRLPSEKNSRWTCCLFNFKAKTPSFTWRYNFAVKWGELNARTVYQKSSPSTWRLNSKNFSRQKLFCLLVFLSEQSRKDNVENAFLICLQINHLFRLMFVKDSRIFAWNVQLEANQERKFFKCIFSVERETKLSLHSLFYFLGACLFVYALKEFHFFSAPQVRRLYFDLR